MGTFTLDAVPRRRAQVGVMVTRALMIVEEAAPFALAQVDVLGASLARRTAEDLLAAGMAEVCVVTSQADDTDAHTPPIRYVKSTPNELWERARSAYDSLSASDAVVLMRMNSYCEVEWRGLLEQHRAEDARVTRAWNGPEPLDVYAVSPRFRKDAQFLFTSELRHSRLPTTRYQLAEAEYAHGLQSAADLREIAVDALHLRCRMRPVGREVRPGIWMGERSRVDAAVRLVAPVYIGKSARVRTGAVITRGSSLEHHASVDCGTVVEDASVLPFTAIGAGLDVVRSVVGHRQVADLKRDVVVNVEDRTLVDEVAHNAGVRVLGKAAALVAYLPLHFWKGVTGGEAFPQLEEANPACAPEFPATVFKENAPPARALRPELVMERYGNQ